MLTKLLLLLSACFFLAAVAGAENGDITEKRKLLIREYSLRHYGRDTYELKDPKVIIIHHTAVGSLQDSLAVFAPDTLSPHRHDIKEFGSLNVGAHFLVDRDGSVHKLLPTGIMARHTIGFNHTSLAIENVAKTARDLTQSQVKANADLAQELIKANPSVEYLIGHHEYARKDLPHYFLFLENAMDYTPIRRDDPGANFISQLRAELKSRGVVLKD